jgi:glycosyltransferase involved in cell wall biosynthesis
VVPVKIAILGTRGVPPSYGGFETFAGELSTRLVDRGHDVTVYCRRSRNGGSPDEPATWNGVRRLVLPAVGHKYFETVSHTLVSALDAWRRDFDVALVCNAANAFVLPILRAARLPVAINVDGIERKRRKWNVLGRAVYSVGEAFSVAFASAVIADAAVIADYYRSNYALDPVTIPYGADFPAEQDSEVLSRLGVQSRGYVLYVSRFEPENNPLEVVLAYEKLVAGSRGHEIARSHGPDLATSQPRDLTTDGTPPLVMVGDGLYAPELVGELKSHASDRILFPGALYGADYRTLQRHALIYVQATEVGGTHPALIEAMGSGGCVLANDTPENREVAGDSAGYFRLGADETLSGSLRQLLESQAEREKLRQAGRERARSRFAWDRVVDSYERLFAALIGR